MQSHKKVADMTWDEVREELFIDYLTGVPNKRAFDHAVKSGTQLHIELPALESVWDLFRHNRRDYVRSTLAQALHEEDPGNVFYVRDVHFKAMTDTCNEAHALMKRINRRLANSTFMLAKPNGRLVVCTGMGFSYALGINEDDAVEAFRVNRRSPARCYVHRQPDCLPQVEKLFMAGAKLVSFCIPAKV